MKKLRYASVVVFLVSLALAVVTGLLQIWLPDSERWWDFALKCYRTSIVFGGASALLIVAIWGFSDEKDKL